VEEGWLKVVGPGDERRWLPLMAVSHTGIWLGLGAEGQWVVGRLNEDVSFASTGLVQSWLPILDWDEQDFMMALIEAAQAKDLDGPRLYDELPIDEILLLGIRSESRHWAKRSVAWLVHRPLTAEQRAMLSNLTTARWVDQWTRHAARRALRNSDA
jgi:hypothetical protein